MSSQSAAGIDRNHLPPSMMPIAALDAVTDPEEEREARMSDAFRQIVDDEPTEHEEQRHELDVVRDSLVEEIHEAVHGAVGDTRTLTGEDLDDVRDVDPGAVDHERDPRIRR